MTTEEAISNYSTTCYVAPDFDGLLCIWQLRHDVYFVQLSRGDLPGGPIGDEMWARLTEGLPTKILQEEK